MTEGTVYALDVEPKMLQIIQVKAEEENLTNITYLQGAMENVPLATGTADRVIASLVLHEGETLDQGLAEITRVMSLCLEADLVKRLSWSDKYKQMFSIKFIHGMNISVIWSH